MYLFGVLDVATSYASLEKLATGLVLKLNAWPVETWWLHSLNIHLGVHSMAHKVENNLKKKKAE